MTAIPGTANFAGILKVKVHDIRDFTEQAGFMDKTDPFVQLRIGSNDNPKCGECFKTSVKDNAGGTATFNETFHFHKTEKMNVLTVKVCDANVTGKLDLGKRQIDLDLQDFYGSIDEKPPVSFELVHGGKVAGKVYLSFAVDV